MWKLGHTQSGLFSCFGLSSRRLKSIVPTSASIAWSRFLTDYPYHIHRQNQHSHHHPIQLPKSYGMRSPILRYHCPNSPRQNPVVLACWWVCEYFLNIKVLESLTSFPLIYWVEVSLSCIALSFWIDCRNQDAYRSKSACLIGGTKSPANTFRSRREESWWLRLVDEAAFKAGWSGAFFPFYLISQDIETMRKYFEKFLNRFPLCYGYWKKVALSRPSWLHSTATKKSREGV